jgi:hypothetical protein
VSDPLDDSTVAYVLAARPHFESLRDVAAQLAGLLVLAASGARSAAPDHPMLRSAEVRFAESKDGLAALRSPERARPHHRHLTRAADSIDAALAAARDRLGRPAADDAFEPVLAPLKAGYAHLQRASNALPGFEIVSFDHACCGTQVDGPAKPTRPTRPGSSQ